MKNIVKLSESQLHNLISESVKKILTETELSYDMDNFSGRWSRGNRYDILVDDEPYYNDIPEESVDKLVDQLEKQGYENIKVVDLNDDDSEPKNIKNWYDESEETYDVAAMIKSDMNPLSHTFKATSIQDALKQAMKYFTGFTSKGEKDVDIYYIKHHGYDEI